MTGQHDAWNWTRLADVGCMAAGRRTGEHQLYRVGHEIAGVSGYGMQMLEQLIRVPFPRMHRPLSAPYTMPGALASAPLSLSALPLPPCFPVRASATSAAWRRRCRTSQGSPSSCRQSKSRWGPWECGLARTRVVQAYRYQGIIGHAAGAHPSWGLQRATQDTPQPRSVPGVRTRAPPLGPCSGMRTTSPSPHLLLP